jgi:2-hydroxychromene-2-carboxylate isomerase
MPYIEYFYASYSAFAYLGSKKLMQIAKANGRRILHRPVDLGRVVAALGAPGFRQRSPAHRDYYFRREIQRWSEFRNAPVMVGRPTHHDNPIALPNGMLIAGVEQGHNVDALAHAMLEAHWRDDADLADHDTLTLIGMAVGLNPEPLLDAALSPEIQKIYAAYTNEAIERSVFGSPTYFVDGDMFYGQDRLEMVERALRQPFAGSW